VCLVFETAVFSASVLILLCIFNSLNQLTNREKQFLTKMDAEDDLIPEPDAKVLSALENKRI